jgi:cytochrome c-type biogenesis protein CcmH
MTLFLICAAAMLGLALVFVLAPLLRARGNSAGAATEARRLLDALKAARDNGILSEAEYASKRAELANRLLGAIDTPPAARPKTAFAVALVVALLLPAAAIVIYRTVGQPGAIDNTAPPTQAQEPANHGQNIDQAIDSLKEKLKQNPKDIEGWALLGRAYEATERFTEARDALKNAYDLAPDDPDVTVAYAEVLALSGPERRIEGEPRTLIENVLKKTPDHQRGLWLLGISDYQQKKYDSAIAYWNKLIAVLPKGAPTIKSIQAEIAKAQAARDGTAPPPEEEAVAEEPTSEAQPAAVADANGPHLTVKVTLDPKLKSNASPGDTLFVYAKAASGPPMPLAIQRLQADKLPTTITLTDGMGMMPTLKLSQFPQVIVGARISKSGNAIAQSGDLQVVSKPMSVTTTAPIELTIDQVVP